MRLPVALLVLLIVSSTTAYSQTLQCIAQGVMILDTVQLSLGLPGATGPGSMLARVDTDTEVVWEYYTTRTAPGVVDLHIPIDSIRFNGSGGSPDSLSTHDLFALIAQTSIVNALSLGHLDCVSTCPGITVRVYQQSCVQRLGFGSATSFVPCGEAHCCAREYMVCCPGPDAIPVLTPLPNTSTTCSSAVMPGCESTCQ